MNGSEGDREPPSHNVPEQEQTEQEEGSFTQEGRKLPLLLQKRFIISLHVHHHLKVFIEDQVAPGIVLVLDSVHQESQTKMSV